MARGKLRDIEIRHEFADVVETGSLAHDQAPSPAQADGEAQLGSQGPDHQLMIVGYAVAQLLGAG